MKIKILTIIMILNFFSCLLITRKIELNKRIETNKSIIAELSLDYAHEINGSQIEITSEEIDGILSSIITGLEKNNIKVESKNFEQIIEVKIRINEIKNTIISRFSSYTYSLIPHYLKVGIEYNLKVKDRNGEVIRSHTFSSESKGYNSIFLFPIAIFYNPKNALSYHLIDATDLLINQN
ncbi:hypothetical protein AB3N60_11210 [Leptospira sp. WS39.C2]